MTKHVFSPSYQSIREYVSKPGFFTFPSWASRNEEYERIFDMSWTDAFLHLNAPGGFDFAPYVTGWVDILGSREALDEFLFRYLFSRSYNDRDAIATNLMDREVMSRELHRWVGFAKASFWEGFYGDGDTEEDENFHLLCLFALCFPTMLSELIPWLRYDRGVDFLRVAELLEAGCPSAAVLDAVENDIDPALFGSMRSEVEYRLTNALQARSLLV
jgi:hypothetical protein